MSIRDIQLAAAERLMLGMQAAISRFSEENEKAKAKNAFANEDVVLEHMIRNFRRVEKLLGFQPGSWRAGV